MATIILSILWWFLKDKKGLGIASIIFSCLGVIIDAVLYGWAALIDVIFLTINIYLYIKRDKEGLL